MMWSMGSQGVRLDGATEQQQQQSFSSSHTIIEVFSTYLTCRFPRITGLDEDPQFLRFTSGLLLVKACNVKHKITSTLREVSNLYYFMCINVIETRPLEDRN